MAKHHFSNYYLIFSALLLSIVLISSLPVQAYALSSMFSGSPPKTTSRTHVYEDDGFRFDWPKGWIAEEDTQIVALAPSDKSNTFLAIVVFHLSTDQLEELIDAKSDRKEFEKLFADSYLQDLNVNISSPPKFTYYNNGIKVTFSITDTTNMRGKDMPMKGHVTMWISQDNERVYHMIYVTNKNSYNTNLQTLKTALKSFYVFPT